MKYDKAILFLRTTSNGNWKILDPGAKRRWASKPAGNPVESVSEAAP